MKPIHELLGFAVLTSPLWLILLFLGISIWIAAKLGKRFAPGFHRSAARAGIFLFVFCLPFGDEMAGRIYLAHLCATEAGPKVYQTIDLPAEYWDKHGKPRFYVNQYGHNRLRFVFSDKAMVDEQNLQYTWVTYQYSNLFHIDRDLLRISDRGSGAAIGQYKLFRYWGGWIVRNLSPHNTATSCEAKDLDSWTVNIFKPSTSVR